MWFKTVVFLSVLSAVLAVTNETNRESYVSYKKKYYGELYKKFERANELENERRSEEYAGEALSGVYSECLAQISFSCLQKKVLNFINRMNRMEKFSLLGNYVSVVRTKNDYEPEAEFQARLNKEEKDSGLDDLMDNTIDRFFNNHIIRFKIPNAFAVLKNSEKRNYQEEATALDFRFPYVDETEGRKKKGGGKMGKKMMMMMMSGLKTKLMLMGPMMMGMAGLMSMKSIMMSLIALMISKVMLIKKLMMMKNKGGNGGGGGGWDNGGGGGGGPWSSGGGSGGGGGGGWDRRNMQDRWDASNLAYRAYSTVENLF
ncbi:UNVERIFIED_CONTAM: hypothetical protein PYX00_004754 [Menopon gallinae]|uniref:Uncharacterized protein n=1 Tax=Menopon gallinae TaxID=328185 RepID=A0AAW2I5X4_9NEOP